MSIEWFPAPFSSIMGFFPWITGASAGSTYEFSRWIFLRSLGVVYLIAFLSLWVQVKGLIGSQGILPAQEFLDAVSLRYSGAEKVRLVPTVFWFTGAGDIALVFACVLGVAASALLIFGVTPALSLTLLFVLYLSLFSVGRDFLSFQWDILLLEAGFLAIFFAATKNASPVMLFLLWWLLFRFMFESGVVKLNSGDASWRDLTAFNYHYFTQPLATWTAWYMHHLPLWFHKLSIVVIFVVELLLPFFIFFSRPLRMVSSLGIIFLMIVITFTGNYNFFTLLTIALCFLLFDDALWQSLLPERFLTWLTHSPFTLSSDLLLRALPGAIVLVTVVYLLVSVFQLLRTTDHRLRPPRIVQKIEGWVDPLRVINPYGLFRVMTKNRPEIIVEGSNDGQIWLSYEFKWKPGDLSRRPGFIEPHQPRLDWQMWFAALSRFDRTPWFRAFLGRLLEGSPDVLALLKHNPFPENPPKYIRASLYHYTFSSPEERKQTGAWWRRESRGLYAPALSLK